MRWLPALPWVVFIGVVLTGTPRPLTIGVGVVAGLATAFLVGLVTR